MIYTGQYIDIRIVMYVLRDDPTSPYGWSIGRSLTQPLRGRGEAVSRLKLTKNPWISFLLAGKIIIKFINLYG